MAQPAAAPPPAPGPALDYDFFKARVLPILITKRPGHARCIECHDDVPRFTLPPVPKGAAIWGDADARTIFDIVKTKVIPGQPDRSRLLRHPLAEAAGGDPSHDGGKHWTSKSDPEWQTLAAWVNGATLANPPPAPPLHERIIQTNSAGDDVHIIDPKTNTVVGHAVGMDANHGAAVAPDGSRIYISNEADSTLDVVDARTFYLITKIRTSGHPNNIGISHDGRFVYVSIHTEHGAVDVVDTQSLSVVKSIPIKGAVHNTYVTPDGRYVVAATVAGKAFTVIDQKTNEPLWTADFDDGVRPMAFETNPDGSTKRAFFQLTKFHGFVAVDFATHKEVARIALPKIKDGKKENYVGGSISHGLAISGNKRLIVNSRLNGAVYVYSLPDLTLLGEVDVGRQPEWVAPSSDGKTVYVANAGTNDVSVVDVVNLKEVARIPVGQVPKRNIAAMMQ
jgi:YVTN family beta-propeller protein